MSELDKLQAILIDFDKLWEDELKIIVSQFENMKSKLQEAYQRLNDKNAEIKRLKEENMVLKWEAEQ